MSFLKYPAYKDSGVEWLGNIPQSWKLASGKRIFTNARLPSKPDAEQLAATQAYGVIPQKEFMEQQGHKVVLALSGTAGFKDVRVGDFVISLRSFQGGLEYSAHDGCVSPAYTVLRPTYSMDFDAGYFIHLLKAKEYIAALQSVTTGIREGRTITYEQFGSILLPIPGAAEQTQIARFLDHETARIDALIEEQQRLIELLKEKRQAVISHAVTKGLDPTAPMKDSGVEWLGEVPVNWDVIPLKRAIRKIESGTSVNAVDYPAEPGSHGVLKTSCVYTGQFDWKENKTVDDEDLSRVSCPLKVDTLVVSRMNTPDLVGATGLVTEAPAGIYLPDRLWQVHIEKNQSPLFIFYFTKSSDYRDQVKTICSGTSSSMQNLAQDDFRSILFADPPVLEQTQIAHFLDQETARVDKLVEEANVGIELLQERRSALISAAVTGKIDVRGWQPPGSVPAPESAQEAV